MLLGVLLSSVFPLFFEEGNLINKIPNHPIVGAIVGSLFGFFFPVCECGNIPVARRLLLQGLPISVAISFLLAAPTLNPVVIWSTYVAFRGQPEVFWLRIIFSLIIAISLGCIFSVQKDIRPFLRPLLAKRLTAIMEAKQCHLKTVNPIAEYSLLQSGSFLLSSGGKTIKIDETLLPSKPILKSKLPLQSRWHLFVNNVYNEFRELGGVLILGSAVASGIQVFVPRDIILNLGQDSVTSILAMMILAAVISICSTVDSFFILSFSSTFTTASIVAFLVFGPMIDIKALGLMLSIFRPRMLTYMMIIIAQLTFVLTLGYSYLF